MIQSYTSLCYHTFWLELLNTMIQVVNESLSIGVTRRPNIGCRLAHGCLFCFVPSPEASDAIRFWRQNTGLAEP